MAPYPGMPAPAGEYLALVLDADLRLLAITERPRQHWAAHAAALGLTTAQVKVLLHLTPGEAIPMRKLARQLGHDASNLTTVIDRLDARGALERQADPADRRVKALALTPEGERLRGQFWRNLVTDPGPLTPAAPAPPPAAAAISVPSPRHPVITHRHPVAAPSRLTSKTP
jgi:DNA-binding MarR family transcriptional regulator